MSVSQFSYQAYDTAGNVQSGHIAANSEREAVKLLKGRQLVPVKISRASDSEKRVRTGKKIRQRDLLDFTTGLRTLVDARVPLDKALRLLEGITESSAMRELVVTMRRDVKEGKSLAEAMETRPDVFSRMYINIVRAGEEGGILHQLLPDLADFLETSANNRQAIISAMVYPIVLLVTGVISVFLLLVFVIPQFAIMFQDAGTDVPASAAFLLALSDGVKQYGYLFVLMIVAIVFWWRWQDRDAAGKLRKDAFLLRTPLLGHLLLYRDCAVFARTLGALLGAGIPLIRALRVAREVVSNTELVRLLARVEEDVRGGAGLGISLEKAGAFPTLLHQLVAVGEESGRTGSILLKTAETFDQNVKNQMASLVSALQPGLILLLGIAVGGITITMLSAVFSMNAVQF
ncbi:type II secretion system F family protein [Pseudohongiella sp.]|uniref:Type II secretion system protein GspF domain-containing protein n=1 Tax=marine sediment metagenome TaxID=412755 RepID=A0A0F9YA20_9ZZZZ|nr:type II secretion system F family protein [Pseudohongiella sp.]HDZ08709.1 type II secretion system F family protein [Pseudohongiella sp.]HEA62325.1 type II secretion system F family protein [Pseudohongiella sp.]